jgi:hypothetical protein
MNVMGLLTFSLFFGFVLSRLPPEESAPMIQAKIKISRDSI